MRRLTATLTNNFAAKGQAEAVVAAGAIPQLELPAASQEPDVQRAADKALRLLRSPGRPADNNPAAAGAPAAAPANQQKQRMCHACTAPGCGATCGLRFCGGCRTVRDCSTACSHAHWEEHRAECRLLQADKTAAAAAGDSS